jgi:hypothetical protein
MLFRESLAAPQNGVQHARRIGPLGGSGTNQLVLGTLPSRVPNSSKRKIVDISKFHYNFVIYYKCEYYLMEI